MRIELALPFGRRHFLLSQPVTSSLVRPAVVFLPGAGATAEWSAEETGWSDLAEREGFLTVYPEALPADPAKPARFLTNPQRWVDRPDQTQDLAFLSAVLDEIIARFSVDPKRIFVTGFSNGAWMTFRMAVAMAERIAAIAPVAGHCRLDARRPSRPIPTLYLIGDADPMVPLEGGQVHTPWRRADVKPSVWDELETWAQAIGCSPKPLESVDDAGVIWRHYLSEVGGAELRAGVVPGLGHHWPGGLGRLAERYGGLPSSRLQATELIWRFFSELRVINHH